MVLFKGSDPEIVNSDPDVFRLVCANKQSDCALGKTRITDAGDDNVIYRIGEFWAVSCDRMVNPLACWDGFRQIDPAGIAIG